MRVFEWDDWLKEDAEWRVACEIQRVRGELDGLEPGFAHRMKIEIQAEEDAKIFSALMSAIKVPW